MSKSNKKAIVIIIIVAVIIVALGQIYTILTTFHYEDHLDDTVITIDSTEITLREFGYYIYDIEAYVQEQALQYDSENPSHWWNTHFAAGLDSTYICDYAKETAINSCVCDEIYYQLAIQNGLSLDETEKSYAADEANQTYEQMNDYQLGVTGLNADIILEYRLKQALATKYAQTLLETVDFSSYEDDPNTLLSGNGDYFQDVILPDHTVTENSKILDNLYFGKITVNYE